jgi:hypothetical protein
LIDEVQHLSGTIRTEPRDRLLQECAKDIALKLPGKGQPTYLNACESLIDAYTN